MTTLLTPARAEAYPSLVMPEAIGMALPQSGLTSACDAVAIASQCADLSQRIASDQLTLEQLLEALTLIVSTHGGHGGYGGGDGNANGERAAFALARVVFRFNRYQASLWSSGCAQPSRTTVSVSGANALIISHPLVTPIRIEAQDGVLVLTHARGRECLPLMSCSTFRETVRRIWINSWFSHCGLSAAQQDLLRGLRPGSFAHSIGVRDPWVDDDLWHWWLAARKAGPALALAVQRRLFSCGRRIPVLWLRGRPLWGYPLVVKDILAYPAAAIAAARIDDLLSSPSFDQGLKAMSSWMDLFAPEGMTKRTANRSLRRTLMNLPAGIWPSPVMALRALQLDRPLTQRLVLMAHVMPCTAWDADRRRHFRLPRRANQDVLDGATEADLADTVQAAREAGIMQAGPLSALGLTTLFRYLLDYPDRYHGTVLGLWRRSRAWHQSLERTQCGPQGCEPGVGDRHEDPFAPDPQEPRRDGADGDRSRVVCAATMPVEEPDPTPVAVPAWELPPIPGLTFLATVGAIRQEGRTMGHCVGSSFYLDRARDGCLHVFHVERNDQSATVAVMPDGASYDIQGPGNRRNQVCVWVKRRLSLWRRAGPIRAEPARSPAPAPGTMSSHPPIPPRADGPRPRRREVDGEDLFP